MKRLGTMEKVCLVLAIVFIAVGVFSIVYPTEAYVAHAGSGRYQSIIGRNSTPEHVSKNGARVYGFISLGFGVGLAWLVFYRPRN
jgi:hypothetical protein